MVTFQNHNSIVLSIPRSIISPYREVDNLRIFPSSFATTRTVRGRDFPFSVSALPWKMSWYLSPGRLFTWGDVPFNSGNWLYTEEHTDVLLFASIGLLSIDPAAHEGRNIEIGQGCYHFRLVILAFFIHLECKAGFFHFLLFFNR